MGLLAGKVAIVTGAGRGIGRAEALALGAAGARVVVNDLGVEWDGSGRSAGPADAVVEEIRRAGGEALPCYESVADFAAARRIIATAIDGFGRLDILVNNAGFVRDRMLFNLSEEEWDAVVNVHLKGTFNTARWAAAHFRERREGGRIINTTSLAGLCGNVGQSNYSAAKAGIAVLTLVWAQELAKYGVTCNAIAPVARTRMTEQTFGAIPGGAGFDPSAPENVAPMVVFLASDGAARVNGYVFGVKGGEIEVYAGWHSRAAITREGPWTAEEIAARIGELL